MEVSPKKLVVGLGLIFLLGIMFAIVNGNYVQENEEPLPLLFYVISLVSIVVGGFMVILFQWKINKVQLQRVLKILPADERKIVSLLLENNNALEQNKLVAFTGINKVKMSRIISELEKREVLKKTNLGNTNLIVLNI
jgi:uncharacterized membrane protein